jgi:hypothetical protein
VGSHLGECNTKNKHGQDIRVEKDLLPAIGKESTGVISKVMSSPNKGSMGILFREPIHIHKEAL